MHTQLLGQFFFAHAIFREVGLQFIDAISVCTVIHLTYFYGSITG